MSQSKEIQKDFSSIEKALMMGDLSRLTEEQRLSYYQAVCESVGLNALTKPFEFVNLNGRLILYAGKNCAEQLRKIHKISIYKIEKEIDKETYSVTAYARLPDGREDASLGSVNIFNLKGDALCNAKMKCETKAKRRVTLSIVGLGMLDESEIESIPQQQFKTIESTQQVPARISAPPSIPNRAPGAEIHISYHDHIVKKTPDQFIGKKLKDIPLSEITSCLTKWEQWEEAGKKVPQSVHEDIYAMQMFLNDAMTVSIKEEHIDFNSEELPPL